MKIDFQVVHSYTRIDGIKACLLRLLKEALQDEYIERMEEEEVYYGEINELKGVWATGFTQEECKANLKKAIEEWIQFSTYTELPISALEDFEIRNIEIAGIV